MGDEKLGLRSEELRTALNDALAGRKTRLAELLARHGGLPGPRPNLALATALGAELERAGKNARALLDELGRDDAKDETARVFLPIAAAHGYVARIESDADHAWEGIFELAADDRTPVRVGVNAALGAWLARAPTNVDVLVARAAGWVEHDDRDHRFAACAIVLDVIAERHRLDALSDRGALLVWMERVIAEIAEAPRAAERSPARRKILAALPGALAEVAASLRGALRPGSGQAEDGLVWLVAQLAEARHPDLRIAMEQTIDALRKGSRAQGGSAIESMRAALASSAKPNRDAARVRHGMSGRGTRGGNRSR